MEPSTECASTPSGPRRSDDLPSSLAPPDPDDDPRVDPPLWDDEPVADMCDTGSNEEGLAPAESEVKEKVEKADHENFEEMAERSNFMVVRAELNEETEDGATSEDQRCQRSELEAKAFYFWTAAGIQNIPVRYLEYWGNPLPGDVIRPSDVEYFKRKGCWEPGPKNGFVKKAVYLLTEHGAKSIPDYSREVLGYPKPGDPLSRELVDDWKANWGWKEVGYRDLDPSAWFDLLLEDIEKVEVKEEIEEEEGHSDLDSSVEEIEDEEGHSDLDSSVVKPNFAAEVKPEIGSGVKVKVEVKEEPEDEDNMYARSEGNKRRRCKTSVKEEPGTKVPNFAAEVKPEIGSGVKVKVEVKEEPEDEDNMYARSEGNKRRRCKTSVKEEPGTKVPNFAAEVKPEIGSGVKVKVEVKEEPEDEDHMYARSEGNKRRRCQTSVKEEPGPKVKSEVTLEISEAIHPTVKACDPSASSVKKKKSWPRIWPRSCPSSFAARLPLWNEMCINFHKKKLSWAPTRLCCLPSLFLSDVYQAPPQDESTACYHRLDKEKKREFRRWIENMTWKDEFDFTKGDQRFEHYLHPEKQAAEKKQQLRSNPRAPPSKVEPLREWEHQRITPRRLWIGRGWKISPDGVTRMAIDLVGSKIYEGVGQVKVPCKRKGEGTSAKSQKKPAEQASKHSGSKGVTWNELSGQWEVVWYIGTWRQVKAFHMYYYWPRGTYGGLDELDRNVALEESLKAALAFYEEKKSAGLTTKPHLVRLAGEAIDSRTCEEMTAATGTTEQEAAEANTPLGIYWRKDRKDWYLQWWVNETRIGKSFSAKPHLKKGLNSEEARAAAYKEACDAHADLVSRGIINIDEKKKQKAIKRSAKIKILKQQEVSASGARKGRPTLFNEASRKPKSCVPCISWCVNTAAWRIFLKVPQLKKRFTGGSNFQPSSPSAHNVEMAFHDALATLQNLQREHGLPVTDGGAWRWIDKS